MNPDRSRSCVCLPVLLFALAVASTALAVQTRNWTEGPVELQRGHSEGIAVTSRGRILLGPRLARLGGDATPGGAAQIWSMVADPRGNVFLGTGPDGRILRVGPRGDPIVLFSAEEPMVTALLLLPDGDLLAGTAPEGKIYRVRPDGKGEVWCTTGERYVWSLALGPDGTVYAGTGDQGIVLRIGRSGQSEPFFDSDESHIMALVALPGGSLVAGGAGRGLVYRIDPKGNPSVLYDSDLPEVTDLAPEADGSIVAAMVAPPEVEPRPPAVRIQVPQNAPVGSTPDTVADLEERNAPALEGIIEGLSSSTGQSVGRRVVGRVVRIAPSGFATELWRSSTEAPLCLALDGDGRPVFGTGEPARLYHAGENGEVDLLATLREAQVTGLVRTAGFLVASTSNPPAAYRLEHSADEVGVFLSEPFDAQAPARWGKIRWRTEGSNLPKMEFQARSGNSAEPDGTWSSWGPAVSDSEGGPLSVPDGRFLQWRAKLAGEAVSKARIEGITCSYTNYNRAPFLENFRLDGQSTSVMGPASFRWDASDPDGDPLTVVIQYRTPGTVEWKTAVRTESSTGTSDEPGPGEGKAVWETADVPEGRYEVRAVASDDSRNAPGEGREYVVEPSLLLTVDRTVLALEARRLPDGTVEITADDELSALLRVEVVEGDRVLFVVRPEDGVFDSRRETMRLSASEAGEGGLRKLRAVDSAGNVTEREMPAR